MTDQDTPAPDRRPADEDEGRVDDRNEPVDDSPAPDPTEGERGAEDVPTAD
jgi:hypothetical protein